MRGAEASVAEGTAAARATPPGVDEDDVVALTPGWGQRTPEPAAAPGGPGPSSFDPWATPEQENEPPGRTAPRTAGTGAALGVTPPRERPVLPPLTPPRSGTTPAAGRPGSLTPLSPFDPNRVAMEQVLTPRRLGPLTPPQQQGTPPPASPALPLGGQGKLFGRAPSGQSLLTTSTETRGVSTAVAASHLGSHCASSGVGQIKSTTTLHQGSLRGAAGDGPMFLNQYAIIKMLGTGAQGNVQLCLDLLSGELKAMKMVAKTDPRARGPRFGKAVDRAEMLRREANLIKDLDHPNIVTVFEIIDDAASPCVLVAMEFVEGGTVQEKNAEGQAHCFAEGTCVAYAAQLVDGLAYLHENGVVHGDIKPDNILLSANGEVKLSDFGSATVFHDGDDSITSPKGTPSFLAPEAILEDRYSGVAADVWALGATLFHFLFGRIPFGREDSSPMALYDAILEDELVIPEGASEELRSLLGGMLEKDPAARLTLEEVASHPWLRGAEDAVFLPGEAVPEELTPEQAEEELAHEFGPALSAGVQARIRDLAAAGELDTAVFQDGQYLMKEGTPGTWVALLLSGVAEVLKLEGDSDGASRRPSPSRAASGSPAARRFDSHTSPGRQASGVSPGRLSHRSSSLYSALSGTPSGSLGSSTGRTQFSAMSPVPETIPEVDEERLGAEDSAEEVPEEVPGEVPGEDGAFSPHSLAAIQEDDESPAPAGGGQGGRAASPRRALPPLARGGRGRPPLPLNVFRGKSLRPTKYASGYGCESPPPRPPGPGPRDPGPAARASLTAPAPPPPLPRSRHAGESDDDAAGRGRRERLRGGERAAEQQPGPQQQPGGARPGPAAGGRRPRPRGPGGPAGLGHVGLLARHGARGGDVAARRPRGRGGGGGGGGGRRPRGPRAPLGRVGAQPRRRHPRRHPRPGDGPPHRPQHEPGQPGERRPLCAEVHAVRQVRQHPVQALEEVPAPDGEPGLAVRRAHPGGPRHGDGRHDGEARGQGPPRASHLAPREADRGGALGGAGRARPGPLLRRPGGDPRGGAEHPGAGGVPGGAGGVPGGAGARRHPGVSRRGDPRRGRRRQFARARREPR